MSLLTPKFVAHLATQASTIQAMIEAKALMVNKHFDFGNGYHGSTWIDPHKIFQNPHHVTELLNDMIEYAIPEEVLDNVQVVVGPERGGAKVGLLLALMLDARRELKKERVKFAEIQEDDRERGRLILPSSCQQLVADKFVLLVDDVRNTGRTFKHSFDALIEARAKVMCTAEWYDRLNLRPEYVLDVPNYPLAEYADENLVMPADQCNMCRLGTPIIRF